MEFIFQYIINVWQLERLRKRLKTDKNLPYFDRKRLASQINLLSETNSKMRDLLKRTGVLIDGNS